MAYKCPEHVFLHADHISKIYPLSVDRPYRAGSSGQMRTRIQAFVERMEIKKIQNRRGGSLHG